MDTHEQRTDFVKAVEIARREPVLGGQSFGAAGPYEKIAGTIRFAADPEHAVNRAVTDIGLAPRNSAGRVEFSGDFYILKPVDMKKGNGRMLCDVGNRERKVALGKFYEPIREPVQNRYTIEDARTCLERSGLTVTDVIHTGNTPAAPLIGPHVIIYVCQKPAER